MTDTVRSTAYGENKARKWFGESDLFVDNISKSFGAQRALESVTLKFRRGEKHALLGSNGAGKSTLAWLLAGRYREYGGRISIANQPIPLTSRARSQKLGIEIVTQEPALAPNLSVADNLLLGSDSGEAIVNHKLRRARAESLTRGFFDELGVSIDLAERTATLPLIQRQIVDLLRAAIKNPAFFIIDEPPLFSDAKYETAFRKLLEQLCSRRTGILLITHHIDRALSSADTVTVIRDGRSISSCATSATTVRQVYEWMFPQSEVRPSTIQRNKKPPHSDELGLTVRMVDRQRDQRLTFSTAGGNVVGLQAKHPETASRILRSIAGIEKQISTEVSVNGVRRDNSSPQRAKNNGIAYLSSDREREAGFPYMSVRDNLTFHILNEISYFGLIQRGIRDQRARALTSKIGVDPGRLNDSFSTLSGGNQQRILLGRMIAAKPAVCLLDEPNRGVDAASLINIREKIHELSSDNAIVLIASTDEAFLNLVCDDLLAVEPNAASEGMRVEGDIN